MRTATTRTGSYVGSRSPSTSIRPGQPPGPDAPVGYGNSVSRGMSEFVLVDEAAEEVDSVHAGRWRQRVAWSRKRWRSGLAVGGGARGAASRGCNGARRGGGRARVGGD